MSSSKKMPWPSSFTSYTYEAHSKLPHKRKNSHRLRETSAFIPETVPSTLAHSCIDYLVLWLCRRVNYFHDFKTQIKLKIQVSLPPPLAFAQHQPLKNPAYSSAPPPQLITTLYYAIAFLINILVPQFQSEWKHLCKITVAANFRKRIWLISNKTDPLKIHIFRLQYRMWAQ